MRKEFFECSLSWVQSFRARYNIVTGKAFHEATGFPEVMVDGLLNQKWPILCEGCKPAEIFNADERTIF